MKITQTNNPLFPFCVMIRDTPFNFRSWKIAEKKSYLSILNEMKVIESEREITLEEEEHYSRKIRDILVFNCLEEKHPINSEEYRFLLVAIRNKSISHQIGLGIQCDQCNEIFEYELDLDKVFNYKADNFSIIEAKDETQKRFVFELTRIGSQELYDDYIAKAQSPFEALYVDFIFHIKSVNDQIMNTEDKFKLFNNCDVNMFEDIFYKWENMRFKLDTQTVVKCPHCNSIEEYSVEEVPGFFPQSWTE